MHQHVAVVHGHPLCVAQSVYGDGFVACFPVHILLDGVYDGGYLAGRISLADDEIIADGVINGAQVCYYNAFTFFSCIPSVIFSTSFFASFIIMLLTTDLTLCFCLQQSTKILGFLVPTKKRRLNLLPFYFF